jgi:anti-sigma B factor antagonist
MTGDIEITVDGSVVVVRLRGEIDMTTTPTISAHVLDALTPDASGLIVDLTEIRYVDSGGVHLLFELARRLEAGRQGLALVVSDESPLRRLLKITNLAEAVAICTTHGDAMIAVGSGARRAY